MKYTVPGNPGNPDNNPINRLNPLGLRAEVAEQPSRMSILQGLNQGPGGFTPSPAPLPPGVFTPSPVPDRGPGGFTPSPPDLGPGGFTPSPPPERPGGFTPSEPGSTAFFDKPEGEEGPEIPEGVRGVFGEPETPPGPEWVWKGDGPPGSDRGNWVNEETGQKIHPDLEHPDPKGVHLGFTDSDGAKWDIFPDGRIEPVN